MDADGRSVLPGTGIQVQSRVGLISVLYLPQDLLSGVRLCDGRVRGQPRFRTGPGNRQGTVISVIQDRFCRAVLFQPVGRDREQEARESLFFCLGHQGSDLLLIRQGIRGLLTGSAQEAGTLSAEQARTEAGCPQAGHGQKDQQILQDEFTVPDRTSGRES